MSDLFKDLGFKIQDIKKIDRKGLNTKMKTPIFGTEIEFDQITKILDNIELEEDHLSSTRDIKYKKVSDFPSVVRDLSFSLDKNDALKQLIEIFDNLSKTQPIGRMGSPQEIADLALFLCSDESSFITGSNYGIDGGFITLNSK